MDARFRDSGITAYCKKCDKDPVTGVKTGFAKFELFQEDGSDDIVLNAYARGHGEAKGALTFGLSTVDPESADFAGLDLTLGRF